MKLWLDIHKRSMYLPIYSIAMSHEVKCVVRPHGGDERSDCKLDTVAKCLTAFWSASSRLANAATITAGASIVTQPPAGYSTTLAAVESRCQL